MKRKDKSINLRLPEDFMMPCAGGAHPRRIALSALHSAWRWRCDCDKEVGKMACEMLPGGGAGSIRRWLSISACTT